MSRRGPNLARRADLERALKRAKPKDEITLDGLATLMGQSKQRFVNHLRDVEKLYDMPAWRLGPRQIHVYPARKAISVLLEYEKRNDDMASDLQKRTAAILGRGTAKKGQPAEAFLPINDLATLSRVMIETEAREREQGLYVTVADVAASAARAFSIVSDYLSDLAANIDPNGLLPADVRAVIQDGGRSTALQIHAEMKDMLSGHARPKPRNAPPSRKPHGRARRAPARRKRG